MSLSCRSGWGQNLLGFERGAHGPPYYDWADEFVWKFWHVHVISHDQPFGWPNAYVTQVNFGGFVFLFYKGVQQYKTSFGLVSLRSVKPSKECFFKSYYFFFTMWYLIQKILIQKRDSHRSGDNFPSMMVHKLILCLFWIPPTFLNRLAVPIFRKSKQ